MLARLGVVVSDGSMLLKSKSLISIQHLRKMSDMFNLNKLRKRRKKGEYTQLRFWISESRRTCSSRFHGHATNSRIATTDCVGISISILSIADTAIFIHSVPMFCCAGLLKLQGPVWEEAHGIWQTVRGKSHNFVFETLQLTRWKLLGMKNGTHFPHHLACWVVWFRVRFRLHSLS